MKNLKKETFVLVFVFLCLGLFLLSSGCSGKHCIKVGGNYEGIQGDLEYCYDAQESKALEAPIFNGDKGKAVLLSETAAKEINGLIEEKDPSTPKIMVGSEIKKLLNHLKKR